MLEQHKETLAREVAIHKEDLAFDRMEFEYQKEQDAYRRERDAKQDVRRHYAMLLDDRRDRYDDWERISTEIRQLQSGFFRRFFQSKADRKELQILQTKKEQIKADLAAVHVRLCEMRASFKSLQ